MLISEIKELARRLSPSRLTGATLMGRGEAGAGDKKAFLLGFLHVVGMKRGLSPKWFETPSPSPITISQKTVLVSGNIKPGPSPDPAIQVSISKISLIRPPPPPNSSHRDRDNGDHFNRGTNFTN
jgi:hypothetical protein